MTTTMKVTPVLLALALVAPVVLVGCGGSDSDVYGLSSLSCDVVGRSSDGGLRWICHVDQRTRSETYRCDSLSGEFDFNLDCTLIDTSP